MMTKVKTVDSLNNIWVLTKRNILMFFKNKVTVFFSLLAPVLILIIYVAFMGDIQVDMVLKNVGENIDREIVSNIVNSWMVSGIIGISCITVGLNSVLPIVYDKDSHAVDDFAASPISQVNLLISYFLAAVIITFSLCLVVLIIAITYLGISTGIGFSFVMVLKLISTLLLSCLGSVMMMMFIMSFFKTSQSSTAFTGVFIALIGFITGAYLPLDLLPQGVQNFAGLVPGTHSVGLFRNHFMGNILDKLPLSDSVNKLKESYSLNLNLFDLEITKTTMYIYLACSVVLFFGLYLIVGKIRAKLKK